MRGFLIKSLAFCYISKNIKNLLHFETNYAIILRTVFISVDLSIYKFHKRS